MYRRGCQEDFKVSATENCTSIRYYVGFEHVAKLIMNSKCKSMNNLVASHFDFEVLQLAFTELFAFVSYSRCLYCIVCPAVCLPDSASNKDVYTKTCKTNEQTGKNSRQ